MQPGNNYSRSVLFNNVQDFSSSVSRKLEQELCEQMAADVQYEEDAANCRK